MLKKILTIAFYLVIPLGVLALLSFAVESNRNLPCGEFRVEVNGDYGFLDADDIIGKVTRQIGEIPGRSGSELSLRKIEELINKIYFVERAQVYRKIDGDIVARVQQRDPVARVINAHNESYYIDKNGRLMKTSGKYTARVLIVSGHIPARYSPLVNLREPLDPEKTSSSQKLLSDLFLLIDYIHSDRFWNAWIDQVYVSPRGEFELIPKNGVHIVEFGGINNLEDKFEKLLLFYENGLAHTGWNTYSRINLKYKNQIVCSK